MADYIRPTPQNATLGAIAAALRKAQQFAGQYEIDKRIPLLGGTGVDELLSLPGAASLMEDVSYHGPRALIKGGNAATGGIGTFRLDPRTIDVADVAMNVTPLGMLAGKGVKAGARATGEALNRAMLDNSGPLARLVPEAARPMYVVKPKGGNWLSGSTEAATRPLKSDQAPIISGEIINDAAGRDIFSEYRKVYDRDPTVGLHDWMRATYPEVYASIQNPEERAVSRWIDTKLGKYIKNEMGTPEDPVRALAERGVLHYAPDDVASILPSDTANARTAAGFPRHGMAQSRLAEKWENASDNAINVAQPQDYLKYSGDSAYAQTIRENPWLKSAPPETKVYSPAEAETLSSDLGFDHLIDELKFSMDPSSGLPEALRFDIKDIDKITVPQAVERVAKINAWRAEEAAKAERAGMLENLQATPRLPDEGLQLSFVEKPGGAWVDIPDTVNEKGMPICNSIGKAGGWCTQHEWAASSYGSGDNRLTALVDAEGRPHAQAKITTDPYPGDLDSFDEAIKRLTPEQEADLRAFQMQRDAPLEMDEALAWLQENAPQAFEEFKRFSAKQAPAPDITEIKPVGNDFDNDRAREYMRRDPQYKEKITESVLRFLNSSDWGRVKPDDLSRFDIVDLQDANALTTWMVNAYDRPIREVAPLFNQALEANPNAQRFMTGSQLKQLLGPIEDATGYAGGGIVKGAVKSVGELVQKYLAKEAPVAAAAAAPKEQKMLQGFYRGYAGDYDAGKAAEDAGAVFVTPQRAAGEFYANKRAAQSGLDPHLEMILADPFAGRGYGHAIPTGPMNRKVDFTKARELQPTDVKDRTQLYARGGSVNYDPAEIAQIAEQATRGFAAGGLVNYDPNEIDTIVSKLKEEFHG